jgi:hypothetical protein
VARLREWAVVIGSTRTAVILIVSVVAAGVTVWFTLGNSNIAVQALVALASACVLTVFFLYVVSGYLQPDPADDGEPVS